MSKEDTYTFGMCKICKENKPLKNGTCPKCEEKLPDCFKEIFGEKLE